MKDRRYQFLLLLISLVALFLRLWKLGEIPASMHWDEPSWGYNAYSILKTGRDEYGNFMPLVFKAFGDYKSAIYMYLTAVSVALFGLNEFAVRFPAALFGAIAVILFFYFVKELFRDFKGKEILAIFAGLVLALSPWDYHYSHGAWEINIFLSLLLLGMIFLLKFGKGNIRYLYISEVFFGLCFYVYNSAKLIIPLIVIGLVFLLRDKFRQLTLKNYLAAFAVALVITAPVFYLTFFGGAGGRLKVMSIFSYPRSYEESVEIASEENGMPQSIEFNIFHGNFHYFARGVLGRYLNHFSPKFLFFEGDWTNPRHSAPNSGVLNLLDILLLSAGIYFLIKTKIPARSLIVYLLLITPLPAALSRDIIQATRSFFMIIPISIISAFGAYLIYQKTAELKNLLKVSIWGILVIFYLLGFVRYLDMFIVHLPKENSQFWQYGYKEAMEYVVKNKDQYEKVIFTQKYMQPYIYYLFYSKYDPSVYQGKARLTENPRGDVGTVERLDNIEFRNIYWPKDRFIKNRLYVGNQYELPEKDIVPTESRLLEKIYFLNGEAAFYIVETVK